MRSGRAAHKLCWLVPSARFFVLVRLHPAPGQGAVRWQADGRWRAARLARFAGGLALFAAYPVWVCWHVRQQLLHRRRFVHRACAARHVPFRLAADRGLTQRCAGRSCLRPLSVAAWRACQRRQPLACHAKTCCCGGRAERASRHHRLLPMLRSSCTTSRWRPAAGPNPHFSFAAIGQATPPCCAARPCAGPAAAAACCCTAA